MNAGDAEVRRYDALAELLVAMTKISLSRNGFGLCEVNDRVTIDVLMPRDGAFLDALMLEETIVTSLALSRADRKKLAVVRPQVAEKIVNKLEQAFIETFSA